MTEEGVLHYEVDGRGTPLILLHCWLGSWQFWRGTMEYLAMRRRWRIYALDFWGFGESDKHKATYDIRDYVHMVVQFMDQMGIAQAPIFGHSMGGTVAMSVALDHPDRVRQVAVTGSPMDGESLSFLLKIAGWELIGQLLWRFPPLLNLILWGYSPFVAAGKGIHQQMMEHVARSTWMSFSGSIASLRMVDLRPRLPGLKMPALGIYGAKDGVVHPNQADVLRALVPGARVEVFREAKHFPMQSEPESFNRILTEFLDRGGGEPGRPWGVRRAR
jgi:pimeloyl-ACP methyl ester carboxylesterase